MSTEVTKRDGGPAFPATGTRHSEAFGVMTNFHNEGMTLRQFYAAHAMAALISESVPKGTMALLVVINEQAKNPLMDALDGKDLIASASFLVADAMIDHERKGG